MTCNTIEFAVRGCCFFGQTVTCGRHFTLKMTTEKTRVQLFFRAEGLSDRDTTSKSDPYLLLSTQPSVGASAVLGRTETIANSISPKWNTGVWLDYFFETRQDLSIRIFDDDSKGPGGDDTLGTATFQLAHAVSLGQNATGFKVKLASGDGHVFVTVQQSSTAGKRDTVVFQLSGRGLKKMDTFGQSDAYYTLYRVNPNGTKTLLHTSEVVSKSLTPTWNPPPVMKVIDLTTADMNQKTLRFEMFDKDLTSDDTMGWFDFSFNDLLEAGAGRRTFEACEGREKFGEIVVSNFRLNRTPSFLDYLRGGMQMNLMVSIDFTGSNGDPHQRTSLHHMDPVHPNQYVRAIMGVGDVLLQYDTDKQVPAFGFGARLPDGNVNMCFHLNFDQNPYVPGVQGVLDCYGRALASVRLSGPTNFAPTIATANRLSRSSPGVYTVLLILTDGDITDMPETVNELVACDDAPLSIVVVGVGSACDFAMMDQLDADRNPLRNSSTGKQCRRDLVQFVPFKNFDRRPPAELAAEVLREIPDQVVDWAVLTRQPAPAA